MAALTDRPLNHRLHQGLYSEATKLSKHFPSGFMVSVTRICSLSNDLSL